MDNIYYISLVIIIIILLFNNHYYNQPCDYFEDISGTTTPSPAYVDPRYIYYSPAAAPSPIFAPFSGPVYKIDIPNPPPNKLSKTKLKPIKTITPEQDARKTVGTVRATVEFAKIYPIGTSFDAQYFNYNNLLGNTSVSILNEIFSNVKFKANQNSSIINFNPNMLMISSLYISQEDVADYGKYLVSLMNDVAPMKNSFKLITVNPVSKEQYDNQVKMNYTLEVEYKYPKAIIQTTQIVPKDKITLKINVVMLFEKTFTSNTVKSYLQTFELLGLWDLGFVPGYSK